MHVHKCMCVDWWKDSHAHSQIQSVKACRKDHHFDGSPERGGEGAW